MACDDVCPDLRMADYVIMGQLRVMRVIARMNVGGPAVQVSTLMRHLPTDSFEQVLVTGYCGPDEADYLELVATDVPATRLPGLGRSIRLGDDARVLASLVHVMRDYRPDIVHTHTAKAGVLGRIAASLSGVHPKIVHTYHGHLLHGYFSPAKTRALIAVERMLAGRTHRLVAVGSQVRDDLLAAGIGRPEQYVVIPPGLELRPAPTRDESRRALGLADVMVIAFIGRLTAIKRPDRFLDMVAQVSKADPSISFVIAGDGDLGSHVRSRIMNEALPVLTLGWRDDVELVLSAVDAVVLTSDNEGTPISLIQAGLSGLPVIATNVGSVKDVVEDGVTGRLTDLSAEALAGAVLDLAQNPAMAHGFGRSAVTLCHARYGVERFVRDYASLYEGLAPN